MESKCGKILSSSWTDTQQLIRDRDFKPGHVSAETRHFETQLFFLYQSDQLSFPFSMEHLKTVITYLDTRKRNFFEFKIGGFNRPQSITIVQKF